MSASKNGNGDSGRRLTFLEKTYLEDRERWRKNNERLEKAAAEDRERWSKNDQRLTRILQALQSTISETRKQGDRLDALLKHNYRRSEHGRG